MSYLSQILTSAKEMELNEINSKCSEIATKVDTCKTNVLTYLENVYVRFRERPKRNRGLANKLKQLKEETTDLIDNIKTITKESLDNAENDTKANVESLEKCSLTLNVIDGLYNIHEELIEIKDLKGTYSYFDCMKKFKEVHVMINNLPEELLVLDKLNLEFTEELNSFLYELSNVFRENVILECGDNKSTIRIKNENSLNETLLALYHHQSFITPLDHVTKFLWEHVFMPIVNNTSEVKMDGNNSFTVLEVVTVDPNKKSSYTEVFTNIKTVLSFLSNNFNIPLNEDLSTLSYIGQDLRDNLSELLIKYCLQDTIPATTEGLKEYSAVISATEELQEALVVSGIFTEETTSILEYANNIDILFINKKCQTYLTQAQNLMKKDLHDLIEVGEVYDPTKVLETKTAFSRCSVSSSVQDLISLLERILQEATVSSELCAGRLFCTVQNICQLYGKFVPQHHKKLLQTIPQQIAVFHNNCMFISHKLTLWSDTHLRRLPPVLNVHLNSFRDEGRQLEEVASAMFTSYVEAQIRQVEETMRASSLHRRTLEQVEASTEKCLRQCLRQLELLKTVWHRVLPYALYNRTVGAILSATCGHVVSAVVNCEDISSDAAEQLAELLRMVQVRGSKLFSDPNETPLFVESWYRLGELVFVLGASLVDINDRWADGKGPLALQFKAEELRGLVRALFQNTETRASLLTKIRE